MRELKFKIYDKNDTKGIIGPFEWNKLPQFLFPENFTVLQYTGKNDELEQEVYEGDIVYLNHYNVAQVDMSCLFQIIFKDGSFQLKPIKLGTAPNGGVSDFTWLRYIEGEDSEGNTIYRYELPPPKPICGMNRMRVIGNIFENPELLK